MPEKAIFWKDEQKLILADLHLGKATHFRKNGTAIPKKVEKDNYDRLSQLLLNYEVNEVLILGDLFHSEYNKEWEEFKVFIDKFNKITFKLIEGNHDILKEEHYSLPNLTCCSELTTDKFHFTHIPLMEEESGYGKINMCGHIHPAVKIKGKGRQSLRLPCFYITNKQVILPAFGSFTGMHTLQVKKDDEIYVVSDNQVIKMN